jgi:uncharacterized protein YmfQ (DUF2313 family)
MSDKYARMVKALLPPGSVWSLEPGTGVTRIADGIAVELQRVEDRAAQLVEESDPRTATETLEDWERTLGLPDADVLNVPSTVAERRLAVTQKALKQGGQTPAYFVGVAAACGYTATVSEGYGTTTFRAGRGRAGQPVNSDRWAHVWRMDVQPPTGPALTHAELERIIRRVAPAHTVVRLTYL